VARALLKGIKIKFDVGSKAAHNVFATEAGAC
jgi:hypothetical protein